MPDFTAACMNRNNTGSLNRADLPGADLHLYTEPEVPFLHLYWPQEVFNHWAPVKSSVADITFSGLWFPFESLPLVTKEEHYRERLYLTGKKKKTKQSAKYRVCLATMSEESDVQWRKQTGQLTLQPHQCPPDQSLFHWHQQ